MITPVAGDGRILVRRDPMPTQVGGIDLPPSAEGQCRSVGAKLNTYGTVLAVYPGCKDIKAGQRAVFWQMDGTDIVVDGETVTIMYHKCILAVVEE